MTPEEREQQKKDLPLFPNRLNLAYALFIALPISALVFLFTKKKKKLL